ECRASRDAPAWNGDVIVVNLLVGDGAAHGVGGFASARVALREHSHLTNNAAVPQGTAAPVRHDFTRCGRFHAARRVNWSAVREIAGTSAGSQLQRLFTQRSNSPTRESVILPRRARSTIARKMRSSLPLFCES